MASRPPNSQEKIHKSESNFNLQTTSLFQFSQLFEVFSTNGASFAEKRMDF
jgi:hypothetical protein